MLEILVGGDEMWNESTNQFSYKNGTKVILEHSLISLSKWESKYHKPFLSKNKNAEYTNGEILDYIRFMIINDVDPSIVDTMTRKELNEVITYIDDTQTATWFREQPGSGAGYRGGSEQITSELIYYWLTAYQIPFTCETWNLNRLLTLIRICNVKSNSGKKMSRRDITSQNAALNAARRRQLGTGG